MLIDFEFSGGYVGIRKKYHVNTDDLPKEVAEEISGLVEQSRIFDLQGEGASQVESPPDVFSYNLSITKGTMTKSVSVNDITATPMLHPLLSMLRKLALNQHRGT